MPSSVTPRQDTLLLWPANTPAALSARMLSHTLQLKSSYPASNSLPDLLKATLVIPQMMLSCEYMLSSWSALISKSLQVASSDPVANAFPFGKNVTALMSDSWPVKVCLQMPSRTSQSFAEASQAPETKVLPM